MEGSIANLVDRAARLAGQRVPGALFNELNQFARVPAQSQSAEAHFLAAWEAATLQGQPRRIYNPSPAHLPFIIYSATQGWALVESRGANHAWHATTIEGDPLLLERLEEFECLALPSSSEVQKQAPGALGLVKEMLWLRRRVFADAILATALVSLLALATSLYSMQVFDRVIPNQGFETLWVLTVGVGLSILLEFMLKQIRSHTVDRTCKAIDLQLSEWFFNRMLGIRMEARPSSVGTLASQVKGFELVRGVLASTSLFVLADVPFSLLFIFVIGMIGGWVVLVPLITLPIALATGLAFQHLIQKHTRNNLAAHHRTAGLLVEAVDGAESLKATSSEWMMQSRWNKLMAQTTQAEQSIRNHASLSQNLTVSLQQLSYVALIAAGAYLVTENALTMGGLLACSIIGNRAMSPILQLPGVMVQWAHARAAIEGLEQIIRLPNEADDAHAMLSPQALENSLRFEGVRFSYGTDKRRALEVPKLDIKAGEQIGLLGGIGSGKSTLLKLASGLYRPGEGKVFLGGMDQALLNGAVIREHIAYLPQDARLFSGTLRDNLIAGLPDPGEEAILAAAKRTGLIDLILGQPNGLSMPLAEGGQGVSGGQKQLIALTRLLLAKPRVWLLDEPTGAMDSVTEGRIVQLLKELASEGITLITATHKTALLPIVDRLIMLQGGRILIDGPRNAVLAKLSGRAPAAAQGDAA